MLVCYARELKEGFAAYTEDVVKIMVSHLKFYFHDGEWQDCDGVAFRFYVYVVFSLLRLYGKERP